mgnify:CR=1 FL=1
MRVIICAVGVWLLGLNVSYASPITAQEPQLRAAVILGIIRFTSWPDDTNKASLNICAIGKPSSEPVLQNISRSAEHNINIRSLRSKENNLDNCNIIIFGPGIKKPDHVGILQRIHKLPVLSICDDCNYKNHGADVTLVQQKNRIGFKIDLVSAKSHGISLSSSLLELALEVQQ